MTYLLKGKGPPLEVTFNLEDILKEVHKDQATVIWPSLFGGPDSGLDSGLDCGTGLTESCAHPTSKQHTHYYTTVYLHHMN